MKRLWLLYVIALGTVFFAGCTTDTPTKISSANEMISFYEESNAMTCTLTDFDEKEWEAVLTMYFKNGMFSQVLKITDLGWKIHNDYRVAKNGMKYFRWDYYNGDGFSYDEDLDINSNIKEFFDWIGEWFVVLCKKWVSDLSVFDIPTTVNFSSIEDFFWRNED